MKVKTEKSAGGVVFKLPDKKNFSLEEVEWLVIQHSQHKGWGFPKGLIGDIHKDEDPKEAALREVEEEGGVKAEIVDEDYVESKYTFRWKDALIKKTVYFYLMRYLSGDPKDHDWEVSDATFLPTSEVLKRLTYDSDKEVFKKMLEKFTKIYDVNS